MDCSTQYLPYVKTGFFSKIVQDYLLQHENLKPFYLHNTNLEGVQSSMNARDLHPIDRKVLVEELKLQYQGINLSEKLAQNIQALQLSNTYTITTAHQPNIFTGPLYFIYKIIHTIKLAEELSSEFPAKKFIPVYYMGSEDADLDELGFVHIGSEKLVWNTTQTGAVGRMKVDKAFVSLIHLISGQIGVLPFGNELTQLFSTCYTIGKTIQQATLELVNELFGSYGLIVLVPDNARLKALFRTVIEKELTQQFSEKMVANTISQLQENYKVQAAGRPINLFYLIDDKRERIELNNGLYEVAALSLQFTKDEILQELQLFPERFSPNVILRGAFQESILPNIIFIGGGGELAYWLELKKVFEAAGVAYPLLLLRNSFAILSAKMVSKQTDLGLIDEALFLPTHQLVTEYVANHSKNELTIAAELEELTSIYLKLKQKAGMVDTSLSEHIKALEANALKKVKALEVKIRRAERRKFAAADHQIQVLKENLFPGNSLQERHDNIALFYGQYGKSIIECIHQSSKGLNGAFGLIKLNQ